MYKIVERIRDFYLTNAFFIIVVTLLTMLPGFLYVAMMDHGTSFLMKCIQSMINSFTFSSIFIFFIELISNKHKWGKIIGTCLIFVLTWIECFLILKFHSLFSVSVVRLIENTNKLEINDFFQQYFDRTVLLGVVSGLLLLGTILWFLYKKDDILQEYLKKCRFWLAGVLMLLGAGVALCIYRSTQKFIFYKSIVPVHRLYSSLREARKEHLFMEEACKYRKEHEVKLTKNKSSIRNIVFVVGESLNKHHMELYGYELPTTPHLSKLESEGFLYKYKDVITSSIETYLSLNNMFSFMDNDPENIGQEWYKKGLLPDIMKKAGYYTYWISNQEGPLLSNDICDFVYSRENAVASEVRDGFYDENLFPVLDSVMKNDTHAKRFFVIHLWGSHFSYKLRYPAKYGRFSPNEILLGKTMEQKQTVAEYDNSVLYNDYIVSSIIERFSNEETILFYLSDHGEDVYDFRDYVGRSTEMLDRYVLEIPMLVYMSDSFKCEHPDEYKDVSSSLDRPYESDDIIHTLLDVSDIETPFYDATKSILSSSFDASRKRYVYGKDYDTVFKGKDIVN